MHHEQLPVLTRIVSLGRANFSMRPEQRLWLMPAYGGARPSVWRSRWVDSGHPAKRPWTAASGGFRTFRPDAPAAG